MYILAPRILANLWLEIEAENLVPDRLDIEQSGGDEGRKGGDEGLTLSRHEAGGEGQLPTEKAEWAARMKDKPEGQARGQVAVQRRNDQRTIFEQEVERHSMSTSNTVNAAMKWSEITTRVRYAETDQAGVVYHANYLVWFEIGRVELCRACGFNYRDMEIEEDALLPVTEVKAIYRQPARYDDQILIRTRLLKLRSRAISFAYEIRRASDDQLLATGETHHIVINNAGHARALPAPYARLLREAGGPAAD